MLPTSPLLPTPPPQIPPSPVSNLDTHFYSLSALSTSPSIPHVPFDRPLHRIVCRNKWRHYIQHLVSPAPDRIRDALFEEASEWAQAVRAHGVGDCPFSTPAAGCIWVSPIADVPTVRKWLLKLVMELRGYVAYLYFFFDPSISGPAPILKMSAIEVEKVRGDELRFFIMRHCARYISSKSNHSSL